MSADPQPLIEDPRSRMSRSGMAVVLCIWAVFALAPLVGFLGDHHSAWRVAAVLVAFAAFVVVYLRAMLRMRLTVPSRDEWPLAAALGALTILLMVLAGGGFAAMAVFTAVAAGRILPAEPAGAWVVGCALAGGIGAGAQGDSGAGVAIAFTTLGLGWWMIGFSRLVTTINELAAARQEIARLAVAEERERFSRDLHDLLGQSLSVITLKSELAGRYLPERPEAAAAEVAEIGAVSRRALKEVREAVSGQHRPTLSGELAGAREALGAAGIDVHADAVPAELPPDAEAVLAWAVREGATNVLRHSSARSVQIRLRADGGGASVEVVDDGRGADGSEVDDGTGLAGLAERVARQQGRLEAAPRAEGGFRLAVSVPLGAAA